MNNSLVISTVCSSVEPAIYALAVKLFVLTTDRKGSARHKPTVGTFYETGIVTAIYEHLLMMPKLSHLEIRHEMPYQGPAGAPKRVDLWIRPPNGGYAHLIEAGDFGVKKIHADLRKIKKLNPRGSNWFLAFFRDSATASDYENTIKRSLQRGNGLKPAEVQFNPLWANSFKVYRPNNDYDNFAFAVFKAK